MRYRSVFLDNDGSRATTVLEARDEQDLHEKLYEDGRILVRARPLRTASAGNEIRLAPKKLLSLVQSLESALDAGVPILATLEAMSEQETDPRVCRIYESLLESIEAGQSLSLAMAQFPRSFPTVLCALIEAGESSGSLPAVLRSVAGFLQWKLDIAGTARQATIYPAVVLGAGYGLVLFLLAFVIPRLGEILAKLGDDALPWAGRMLIHSSSFVAAHVLWVVAATVAAVAGVIWMLRTDWGRSGAAALFAKMPVSRTIVRTLGMAQTCRNLDVLLGAGVTVTESLDLTARGVAHPGIRGAIERARDKILAGSKIHEAFGEEQILPPVALSMLRVGEEAGRLPQSLERLSARYDREAKEAVARALALLEPLVTVALGVVVGGVAALVISTIYTAMGAMGK